jgi:hypothetical protein
MKTGLDPTILKTLKAFGRRRRRLLLVRGLCATLATALGALLPAGLIDYAFILPGPARLALSAAVYAVILFVFIKSCLMPLLRRAELRELARAYERHNPELRDQLLAAVELAQQAPETIADSPDFRAHLQAQVAAVVKEHRVDELLPGTLVRRWQRAALAAVALCAGLCLIPGLQYPRLMARVLAPLAELDRAARTKIRILAPASLSAAAPRGEPLQVLIETSGAQPEEAFAELFDAAGKRSRLRMERQGTGRFATALPVAGAEVAFRVRAGDGLTGLIRLPVAPRPAVVSFTKTYHYPAYTTLKERRLTESAGDLEAIEGTSVTLALGVDQPIARGELKVALGKSTETLALRPLNATTTTLAATLTLREAGNYHVALTAAASGLENKFSPDYEIRVRPDAPPSITVTEPLGEVALPERGQILIAGEAHDDIGLARVTEKLSVSGGPWRERVLAEAAGPDYPLLARLRLAPLRLKAGDRVLVRFTATDGKGAVAESGVTTITVGAADTALNRLKTGAERRLLQSAFAELSNSAKALGDQAKALQKAGNNRERRQEELEKSRALAERTAQAADAAWEALQEATRGATTRQDAEDLALLGRTLSQLRRDALGRARGALEFAARPGETEEEAGQKGKPKKRNLKGETDRALWPMQQTRELAERLERDHKSLFTAAQAEGIAEELNRLGRAQAEMARTAQATQDAAEWNRIQRGEEQVGAELAETEAAMARMTGDLDEWQTRDLQGQIDRLKQARTDAAQALADKGAGPETTEDIQKMDTALADGAADMERMKGDLVRRAEAVRQELGRSARKTTDQLREIQRNDREPGGGISWENAIGALEDRAALEEARMDADYQFARDTDQAAEALRSLDATRKRGDTLDRPTDEALRKLEQAYGMIETGHELGETARGLSEMAEKERQGVTNAEVQKQNEQWRGLDDRMRDARNRLGQFEPIKALGQELEQVTKRGEAEAIRNELRDRDRERQSGKRPMNPMAGNFDAVRGALEDVGEKVKAALEPQRQELAAMTLSVGEQAAAAAQEASELKEETRAKAGAANPGTEGAKQALEKQRGLGKRVGRLRDRLRREANAQELGEAAGRDRARDADDALAMLSEAPEKAEEWLGQAARATQPAPRKGALGQAARQQEQLAQDLGTIAKHYHNAESGEPVEATRAELRQAENREGVKDQLDAQYADAEMMARLGGAQSPEDLRRKLEAELPRNPAMRRELGTIADQTLKQTAEALAETARQEGEIGRQLDNKSDYQPRRREGLKELGVRQQDMNKETEALAGDLERAALHAQRLGRPEAGPVRQAGEATRGIAQGPMNQAKQSLEQADQQRKPDPAQQPVEQARQALEKQAGALQSAQAQAAQAQGQPAPAPSDAAGKWMAQTLDRLDQAALSRNGQPAPQQSSAAAAAQARQAMRGQQEAMAQARGESAPGAATASPALSAAARAMAMTPNAPARARANASAATASGAREMGAADSAPQAQPPGSAAALPRADALRGGEWGKLRAQEAQDPAQAKKEAIAEDYRPMVNAYYKALARRGREGK